MDGQMNEWMTNLFIMKLIKQLKVKKEKNNNAERTISCSNTVWVEECPHRELDPSLHLTLFLWVPEPEDYQCEALECHYAAAAGGI